MTADAVNAMEVGENTNLAGTDQAIAHNSQLIVESVKDEAAAGEEAKRLESENASDTGEKPVVEPEAGVYGNIVEDALGGAAIKVASTLAEVIEDGGLDKFNGMKIGGNVEGKSAQGIEDFIKGGGGKKAATIAKLSDAPTDAAGGSVGRATAKVASGAVRDIMGEKLPRSIRTGHFSDIFARASNVSKSVNSDDEDAKIKGVKANETSLAALKTTREMHMTAQQVSKLHLGNAIQHKANIGAQMGQAQRMGITPGGNAPQLALNNLQPKGPTADMLEETGTA
jgi:hypothetical protein